MIGTVAVVVVLVVVAAVVLAKRRTVENELNVILGDLESTVTKLETFAANKEVEITDHLEEIALHNRHVTLKTADAERAARIMDKLTELLA